MFVSPVKAMKYIKKARDNFLILSSLNTLNNCFNGFFKTFCDSFNSFLGLVSGK